MKKVQITLHKDGTQKVEVFGATGTECVAFTQALEQRLGMPLGERVLKPEYDPNETDVERERGT